MGSAFYDAGAVRKIANTLLLGWGYSFYRLEDQLRADDQLVRAKAGWLFGQAAAAVQAAEAAHRRGFPSPSRANPFPDPASVAAAQALERLAGDILAISGRLSALPAPAQDLMSLLYRQEDATLDQLNIIDEQLVGQAELLRTLVQDQAAAKILEQLAPIEEGLAAIRATLRQREAALLSRGD